MLLDITLNITPKMAKESNQNTAPSLAGHLGTHFDVMDRQFPLTYIKRSGIVFDVSTVRGRDITSADINIDEVQQDMFVAFYTGYIEEVPYGTKTYFAEHPQLSYELIDSLLKKQISIIGVDCGGIRRGKEHVPIDQKCAAHNTFVIENLSDLKAVIDGGRFFTAHTYPMRYEGITGLPCRVIAEL